MGDFNLYFTNDTIVLYDSYLHQIPESNGKDLFSGVSRKPMTLLNGEDLKRAPSTRPDGMGRHNQGEVVPQIIQPSALYGFVGHYEHLGLNPEAN